MSLREDADRPNIGDPAGEAECAERVAPAEPAVPQRMPSGSARPAPAAAERAPDRAAPRRRPLRRLVLLAVLAVGLSGGAYAAWQWWSVGRYFVSTDDAYVQADISILAAKVPGYLESVPVVNGQSVRKGEVIAKLDDGDYRLALQAAQDKLATQDSTIARIGRQSEAAEAQVAQASAQIEATRADAVRAQADFNRAMQMQADYVARSRIDQARADRDRTEASVKGMEAGLIAARANVDVLKAQKHEAESLAAELRTAVDRARRDLDFTVIRAPFDGVVGNKAVEAGAYVAPGTRVAALVPLRSVRIDANFKETQVQRMRPGQPVTVTIDAYPDREIQGVVESFSPASGSVFSLLPPDNATGNFTKIVQRLPVRVRVPESVAREGLLRPGLSAVVRVDTRSGADRSVLDRAAAGRPISTASR
jgi:membrane fusion protein, multidrug efflux system